MIRSASCGETACIASILSDAVDWMEANRIPNLWTRQNVKWSALSQAFRIEDFYLYDADGAPVACMAVTHQDTDYWQDGSQVSALYIHKLAVRREYAGRRISRALVAYACSLAKKQHIPYVRLDCNADRHKLRALYESFGFRCVGYIEKNGGYRLALYQYQADN